MAKVGRPPKFKTVAELEASIQAYFDSCWDLDEQGKKVRVRPYTITGLALALDTTRETLLDYENVYEEFSDTIKRAKLQCQNYVEEGMIMGKVPAIPAIFNLKNNYGWKDKMETDHTTGGQPINFAIPAEIAQKNNLINDNSISPSTEGNS